MLWKLEWQKIIGEKKNILMILILIILYAMITYAYQPSHYYDASIKKQIYEQINTDHPYETLQTIENQFYENQTSYPIELILDTKEQIEYQNQYDQNIEEIQKNAKRNHIAIFANRSQFEKANAQKTYQDYDKMKDVSLSFVIPDGFEQSITFPLMDFVLLLICVGLCITLIINEKQSQMLALIRTTKKGRYQLICNKISVLCISMLISVFILTMISITMNCIKYGTIQFDASIASYSLFKDACIDWDVKTLYLVFMLMKWLSYSLLGIILLIIAIQTKTRNGFYFGMILLFLLSALCYWYLPKEGFLSWFKYVNVIPYILTYPLLIQYWNLNFFGIPLEQRTIYYCFIFLFLILFVIICIYLFSRNKMNIHLKTKKKHLFDFPFYTKGILGNELYKWGIVNKGILFTIVFMLTSFLCINHFYPLLSQDEKYYQSYMYALQGEWNEDKKQIIQVEQDRFDQLDSLLMEKSRQYDEGMIDSQEMNAVVNYYTQQNVGRNAFQMVLEQVEDRKEYPQYPFIYEKGYEELFAISYHAYHNEMILACIFSIFLLFMSSSFLCEEYHSGMIHLLKVHYHNEKKVYRIKYMLLYTIMILAYVFIYGMYYAKIQGVYGMSLWKEDLHMIVNMRDYLNMSCFSYFVLVNMIRIIGYSIMIFFIAKLSHKYQNHNIVLLFMILLGLIPLGLHICDIHILDALSLNCMLSGNMLIQHPKNGLFSLLIIGLLMMGIYKKRELK